VTVSRATFCTRRRDSGVIIGPIRSLLVAHAIAASATQGSAMARAGERCTMWSQTKNPSQPCSSAATASSARTRGSAVPRIPFHGCPPIPGRAGPRAPEHQLGEEVGELLRAILKRHGHPEDLEGRTADEAADVLILLISITNRCGINLEEAFRAKEARNETRAWRYSRRHCPVRHPCPLCLKREGATAANLQLARTVFEKYPSGTLADSWSIWSRGSGGGDGSEEISLVGVAA
jgi:NTP pyrophosphatase (non-canonical NTP hydrolase)